MRREEAEIEAGTNRTLDGLGNTYYSKFLLL
jgi:hypothetical protein